MESGSRPPSRSASGSDTGLSPASRRDAFTSTEYTLLGQLLNLGEDGHRQASQHVMEVYARPLKVYYLGSSFADDLGDAEDIVRGFFADRLSRPTFLHDWQVSRKRLRFWLITAFKHYLFEQRAAKGKLSEQCESLESRNGQAPRKDGEAMGAKEHVEKDGQSPEQAFHREVALAIVRNALEQAQESCRANGLEAHWEAMIRHHLDGRTFEELSKEYGIDGPRLRVMARTAGNRFRRCLREELTWNGAHPEDIDQEICSLMEVLQS